jgi:hypothetical protein
MAEQLEDAFNKLNLNEFPYIIEQDMRLILETYMLRQTNFPVDKIRLNHNHCRFFNDVRIFFQYLLQSETLSNHMDDLLDMMPYIDE